MSKEISSARGEWDIEGIYYALRADMDQAESVAYGVGTRFIIGQTGTSIDLFPEAAHLQITTKHSQILAYRVKLSQIEPNWVMFESTDTEAKHQYFIEASGDVCYLSCPQVPRVSLAEIFGQAVGQVEPASEEATTGKGEKSSTVVVSGRLKTKVKEGKPDRKGKPTAWGKLAVYEEGARDAHLYLASFHRHTTIIALGLAVEDHITAEGYPHPAKEEGKLDTFSVINLRQYPGKESKEQKSWATRNGR